MMNDHGLDNLLSLDGVQLNIEADYWVKFEAKKVAETPDRPHGIRYCLTLHDGQNQRLMGFDNAHAVKVSSGYKGRRFAYDHHHRHSTADIIEYEFQTPEQLLQDFWKEVDEVLEKRRYDK